MIGSRIQKAVGKPYGTSYCTNFWIKGVHLVFCDQHKSVPFNLIKLVVYQMCTAAGIKPDYRLIVVPVRLKGSGGKSFDERIIDTINVDFIAPAILL